MLPDNDIFAKARSRQPALRFEFNTGVTGIAGRYRFPGIMTAADCEDMYTWRYDYNADKDSVPKIIAQLNLPDTKPAAGMDIDDYLPTTSQGFKTALGRAWGEIKSLNRSLKDVRPDPSNINEVYSAVYGVVSGFNADDIRHFIHVMRESDTPAISAKQYPYYRELFNDISQKALIDWVPSPRP